MKPFNVRVGLGIILCGLLSGSLLANQATAASFTYNFTGVVIKIPTSLSSSQYSTVPPVTPLSTMSGFVTVDTTDLQPQPLHKPDKIGDFLITGGTVKIGTYSAVLGPGGNLEIKTNGIQAFTVTAPANGPTPADVCCSISPLLFDINLKGVLGFTSDDPSPGSPSISSFLTKNSWSLVFSNGKAISGNLQNISGTAVPLPAAVILFGAGIVALVGLGAGSWRQKKNSLA